MNGSDNNEELIKRVIDLDASIRAGAVAILLAHVISAFLYFSMCYQIFWSSQ